MVRVVVGVGMAVVLVAPILEVVALLLEVVEEVAVGVGIAVVVAWW
mgnify:CR=1 FL=1